MDSRRQDGPAKVKRAKKLKLSDLQVKAKDCIDMADYRLVHKQYLDGLYDTIRRAHGGACVCHYCESLKAAL